jgi:hypothetical protein
MLNNIFSAAGALAMCWDVTNKLWIYNHYLLQKSCIFEGTGL